MTGYTPHDQTLRNTKSLQIEMGRTEHYANRSEYELIASAIGVRGS